MTNVESGLAFARVTSKCKKAGKWHYSLSNGTNTVLADDRLNLGQWYFFHLKASPLLTLQYISHRSIPEGAGEDFALKLQNLEQCAVKAADAWSKLTKVKQQVLGKEISMTLSGVAATGFFVDAAATVAAEGLLGIGTGGLSLLFSGGLAALTYLQYEQNKDALKVEIGLMNEYQKAAVNFRRYLYRICPDEYLSLDTVDPQINCVLVRMKEVIRGFDFSDLVNGQQTVSYNYAAA